MIDSNKKAHRQPLASTGTGYSVRVSKEGAIKARRRAEKAKRLKEMHNRKRMSPAKYDPPSDPVYPIGRFEMSVKYVGEGEIEGVITSPEVIVHARNRANLVRKAQRILTEKHGEYRPTINIPKPSQRIEGVVI